MDKEWFATNELLGVAGLPKSRQGLNKKAKENGWEKRRRKGVQGKGVEYAIWSLPDTVKATLMRESPAPDYAVAPDAMLATWVQIYHQLSVAERSLLISSILREGAVTILARLQNQPERES